MDRITAAKVFIEVVERQSQTAAAEHLDMSKAMVSRHLKALEERVGTRLLHRTTYPKDTLRVACSVSLAQSVLSLLTSEFIQLYPQVRIELLADNKTVNLIEEGIDVALRISNDLDPNQIAIPLGQCHSVLCAAPSYLNKNPAITHPSALKQHNCLSYSYFGTTHWLLSKNQQQYKIPVKGSITSNEANVLLFASLNGAGISQQPRYSAQPLIDEGHLLPVLPDWDLPTLGIHAIYASRQQMTPALRVFIDFIKQKFQTLDI